MRSPELEIRSGGVPPSSLPRLVRLRLAREITLVLALLLIATTAGCAVSATRAKARDAMNEGRWDDAIEHYEAITRQRSFDEKTKIQLDEARRRAAIDHLGAARRAVERGDLDAASARVDMALKAFPKHPVALVLRDEVQAEKALAWSAFLQAHRRLENGDCLEALDAFDPLLAFAYALPELELARGRAVTACAPPLRAKGEAMLERGAHDAARDLLLHADRLAPGDPKARQLADRAGALAKSRRAAAEGRALLATGDWKAAIPRFEAGRGPVEDPSAVVGLTEAKRTGAVAHFAGGAKALAESDLSIAVREFDAARVLAMGQPELGRWIEQRDRVARRRLAAAYVARAERLEKKKLPAAALVYARLATGLARDFKGAAALEARMATESGKLARYRLGIIRPQNPMAATGAGRDVMLALESKLRTQLAGSTAELVRDGPVHGWLSGRIDRFSLLIAPPTVTEKEVEYVAGNIMETNPQLAPRMRAVGDARAEVRLLEAQIRATRGRQEDLDRRASSTRAASDVLWQRILTDNADRTRRGEPAANHPNHPLSGQYTQAKAESDRAKAASDANRAELQALDSRVQGARTRFSAAQKALDETPATVSTPQRRVYRYREVSATIEGQAGGEFAIQDVLTSRALVTVVPDAKVTFSDVGIAGIPATGVKDDPLQLPDENQARRALVDAFVAEMLPQLAEAARKHGDRFVSLATAADGDEALHYRVLAILAGGGDAAALRKELASSHGIDWDTRKPLLASLPALERPDE